jgi:hypothetical protein
MDEPDARYRQGRFTVKGGTVSYARVLELTGPMMLVETPALPPIAIGSLRHFELHGLRGIAVFTEMRAACEPSIVRYAVRVIERDPGLLDMLDDCADREDCTLHVRS